MARILAPAGGMDGAALPAGGPARPGAAAAGAGGTARGLSRRDAGDAPSAVVPLAGGAGPADGGGVRAGRGRRRGVAAGHGRHGAVRAGPRRPAHRSDQARRRPDRPGAKPPVERACALANGGRRGRGRAGSRLKERRFPPPLSRGGMPVRRPRKRQMPRARLRDFPIRSRIDACGRRFSGRRGMTAMRRNPERRLATCPKSV